MGYAKDTQPADLLQFNGKTSSMSDYIQDPGMSKKSSLSALQPRGLLFGVLSGLQMISPSFLFGFNIF